LSKYHTNGVGAYQRVCPERNHQQNEDEGAVSSLKSSGEPGKRITKDQTEQSGKACEFHRTEDNLNIAWIDKLLIGLKRKRKCEEFHRILGEKAGYNQHEEWYHPEQYQPEGNQDNDGKF
jgi:hypothetical protein